MLGELPKNSGFMRWQNSPMTGVAAVSLRWKHEIITLM
jgi:hypothetical protein